jgi:hypothetical protein
VASTGDLPTIAFFRASVLLRRIDLYQAFSQPNGPGRLWKSLGAVVLFVPIKSQRVSYNQKKPDS